MQYELYIDIFFLVNFLLDYLMLLIIRNILRCTATYLRLLSGALIGALGTSILICIFLPVIIKNLILHFGVNLIMLKITFKVHKRELVKAWILLYLVSILMGGVLTHVSQYFGGNFEAMILFISIALITYFIVLKIMDFFECLLKITRKKYRVLLQCNGITREITALCDTGNMLYDQMSGKPVHVISSNAIEKFTDGDFYPLRYIPYHTVQGNSSVMPLIKVERMCIQGKKETVLEQPFLAISECSDFGNGDYELILHPECIRED